MTAPEPEGLKYHQAALDLIGHKPVFSAEAIQQIQEFEERYNIKLPASVKEWYSLADAVELLKDYSDCDFPQSLNEIALLRGDIKMHDGEVHPDSKLLYFMMENAGGTWWYVYLNGENDPPVFRFDSNEIPTHYVQADRFSEFIYTRIWDWGILHAYPYERRFSFYEQLCGLFIQKVGQEILDYFRAILVQEPDFWTHCNGFFYDNSFEYRFHRENKFLLINSDIESDDLHGWKIWAKSGQELLELLQIMRACPYATEDESSQWIKNEEDLANYFS